MEKSCGAVASRRGEEQQKLASGKKKMEPRALETQPKTMSYWLGLFFFFLNQNTPKEHRFRFPFFFFFF